MTLLNIDSGNYNNTNLANKINDKLQIYNSSCSYDDITGKITLTLSNTLASITFFEKGTLAKSNHNLGYIMGFRELSYTKPEETEELYWSITGESICNVSGTKYLQLMLDEFSKNRYNSNIVNMVDNMPSSIKSSTNYNNTIERNQYNTIIETNPRTLTKNQICVLSQIEEDNNNKDSFLKTTHNGGSDLFAMLPTKHHNMSLGDICLEFGGTMQNNKRTYFGPVNISRIHVKLLDDKGNILNLNGNDWSFTLLCETLYHGTEKKSESNIVK